MGGRTSFRGVTADHLPLVGPDLDPVLSQQLLRESRPHLNASSYRSGRYLCLGFGSRGVGTAWLAAEVLVELLQGQEPSLPQELIDAVHPGRIVLRASRRNRRL